MNDNCRVNLMSPILPGLGIGNFTLRDQIKNYYDVIKYYTVDNLVPYRDDYRNYVFLRNPFEIIVRIADCIHVVYNTMNGKIIEITALKGYKGSYNNHVYVGMLLSDFLELEPQFVYDATSESECYKHPLIKGVSINQDPYFQIVESITVYIEELDDMRGVSYTKIESGDW